MRYFPFWLFSIQFNNYQYFHSWEKNKLQLHTGLGTTGGLLNDDRIMFLWRAIFLNLMAQQQQLKQRMNVMVVCSITLCTFNAITNTMWIRNDQNTQCLASGTMADLSLSWVFNLIVCIVEFLEQIKTIWWIFETLINSKHTVCPLSLCCI